MRTPSSSLALYTNKLNMSFVKGLIRKRYKLAFNKTFFIVLLWPDPTIFISILLPVTVVDRQPTIDNG